MRCRLVPCYPPAKIKWEYNGEEILRYDTADEQRQLEQHGDVCSLTFPRVMPENAGEYHCKGVLYLLR